MPIPFTEQQQDTLKETFNLAIGRAAASLSDLVGQEILLTVPSLALLARQEVVALIAASAAKRITAVKQSFLGPFSGMAMLIYPEERSLELVNILLNEPTPLMRFTEMEQESLVEVGNIILNACLGTFANVLGVEFQCDIPEYLAGTCDQVLDAEPEDEVGEQGPMILLYVDFQVHATAIKGYLLLLLDRLAVTSLVNRLDAYCVQNTS